MAEELAVSHEFMNELNLKNKQKLFLKTCVCISQVFTVKFGHKIVKWTWNTTFYHQKYKTSHLKFEHNLQIQQSSVDIQL